MKRVAVILLLFIISTSLNAQVEIDSSRFKLGYGIIDIHRTTIALEGNIELAPNIDAYMAGGYTIKFSRRVPNASENTLKGFYFQLGPRFKVTNRKNREVFYLTSAFGYTSFNHTVTLNYDHFYGTYTGTFSEKNYVLGVIVQIGTVINMSKKLQMDFGFQFSRMQSRTDDLTGSTYYTPGFGLTMVPVQNSVNAQAAYGFIFPKLTLKYKFDFRK